jgi:solute carrier family 25 S-adenosylmethionine transporter 26
VKNPSEILKVRRQAGVTNDTLGAAAELWRNEGLGGFYSSYGSNYAYSTPVDAIKFLLYEQIKGQFKERRQGGALSPIEAAVGGAIAASTAQAIATPLDVARVRIMTSDATGVVDTMRDIAANEGGGALYAGIAPKVVRALASGAIQFSTYEATKEWSLNFLARRFPQL